MLDDIKRFQLHLRLFLDKAEVAYSKELGRTVQFSERTRQYFIQSLTEQRFGIGRAKESKKQRSITRQRLRRKMYGQLLSLAANPPPEITVYAGGEVGVTDPYDMHPGVLDMYLKIPGGKTYWVVTIRTRALVQRMWSYTINTHRHRALFPLGIIEDVTEGQVVIDDEYIDECAVAAAARKWLAALFPPLSTVPIKVLSPPEACLETLESIAWGAGYQSLEAMIADAMLDQDDC